MNLGLWHGSIFSSVAKNFLTTNLKQSSLELIPHALVGLLYSNLVHGLIGVANTKATIVALVATAVQLLAKPIQFFAVVDYLVTVTAH